MKREERREGEEKNKERKRNILLKITLDYTHKNKKLPALASLITPPVVPQQTALAPIRTNKKYFSPQFLDVVARLYAKYNVSAEFTGECISDVLQSAIVGLPLSEKDIARRDTILRAVVLSALCLDVGLVKDISRWTVRGFGFDKTSVYHDRHFFELHLMGKCPKGQYTCTLWRLHELVPGRDSLDTLKTLIDEIRTLQKEIGVPETKYYDWNIAVMDNAADGKGDKNGLGVRFDELRKDEYIK